MNKPDWHRINRKEYSTYDIEYDINNRIVRARINNKEEKTDRAKKIIDLYWAKSTGEKLVEMFEQKKKEEEEKYEERLKRENFNNNK